MPFSLQNLAKNSNIPKTTSSITTKEEYARTLHEITRRTQCIEAREYFASLNELTYDKVDEIFAYFRTAFQIRSITQDDTHLTSYRKKLMSVVNSEILVSKYSGMYLYKEFGETQAEHLCALHDDLSDNTAVYPIENSRSIRGLMKYMLLHYIQDAAIESAGEAISRNIYNNILNEYHPVITPEINQSEFAHRNVIDPGAPVFTKPFSFAVNQIVNRITYKKTIEFTANVTISNQPFVAVLELSANTPCAELMNSILEKGADIKICKNSYMISNTLTGTSFFRFREGSWFLDYK